MSTDELVLGRDLLPYGINNNPDLTIEVLSSLEAPDSEGNGQLLPYTHERHKSRAAELGSLAVSKVAGGYTMGKRLLSAVVMDIRKPVEKPLATRVFVPAGILLEAATISKATSIWSLPLAFSEAGADPSLAKIGLATATLAAVTPAWVWLSSKVISHGTMRGKRSQEVLRTTPLPTAVKKVIPKSSIEQLSYDRDDSKLQNAKRLGKIAFKQSMASFFVVTPQVYNAIFENKSPEEIKKLCNDMTKWSALGAAAVTATATGIVGGFHEIAPGPSSTFAHDMGNSFIYMGLMYSWPGIKYAYKNACSKVSLAINMLSRRKITPERHITQEVDAPYHENHDISLTNTPILGSETA